MRAGKKHKSHTVVNYDRDGALRRDLHPKGLEGRSGERPSKVPAGDHDSVVSPGVGSLLREINGLARAACTSPGDYGDLGVARSVQRFPASLDEGDALLVGEVNTLSHGAGYEGGNAGIGQSDDVGLECRNVWCIVSAITLCIGT